MATPSADHYMRQFTTEQLRAIVGDPILYSVGERLDADAILRDRREISRDPLACCVRWHDHCEVVRYSDGSVFHTADSPASTVI